MSKKREKLTGTAYRKKLEFSNFSTAFQVIINYFIDKDYRKNSNRKSQGIQYLVRQNFGFKETNN